MNKLNKITIIILLMAQAIALTMINLKVQSFNDKIKILADFVLNECINK